MMSCPIFVKINVIFLFAFSLIFSGVSEGFAQSATPSPYSAQTVALQGYFLPLFNNTNPVFSGIWADKLPGVIQTIQAINKISGGPMPQNALIEAAVLVFGGTTVVVSVLRSPTECQDGSTLSLSPYTSICPMRVTLVGSNVMNTIASYPTFCFVQQMSDDPTMTAFNNTSVLVYTAVTYDPNSGVMSFTSTDNGGGDETCSEPPIQLNLVLP